MTPAEARRILAQAELIHSADAVVRTIDRLATEITQRLAVGEDCPLVLTVMGGAVFFAGQLLPKLAFPLECDYLHATRYRNTLQGQGVAWVATPRAPVRDRTVLVLDDILDEGITLLAIKNHLLEQGARNCLIAVLTEKEIGTPKPVEADFVGLRLPDRYVFGCGMDIRGAWRNLPAIYALAEAHR
jgi:hypoxanthine phosphoribosyltransferase